MWRKGRAALTHDKNLWQSLGESTALVTVLQKAAASVAKTAKFDNARQGEQLRFFLVSPDVEAIVRQLYASQLAAQPYAHIESIRAEFWRLWPSDLGNLSTVLRTLQSIFLMPC